MYNFCLFCKFLINVLFCFVGRDDYINERLLLLIVYGTLAGR